jgi:ribosomal protein S4
MNAGWLNKTNVMIKRITKVMYRYSSPSEDRLDVAMWRSTLCQNRYVAARLCLSKKVTVNGIVRSPSHTLKDGDFISINTNKNNTSKTETSNHPMATFSLIKLPISNIQTNIDPFPLHLEVDTSTSSFVFLHSPQLLPRHPSITHV